MAGRIEKGAAGAYIDTRGLRVLAADLRRAAPQSAVKLRVGLRAIAQGVADEARALAPSAADGAIKAGVKVRGSGLRLRVQDSAPAAAAFEVGQRGNHESFRHPVFGHRHAKWAKQSTRPYLAPAVTAKSAETAVAVQKLVDDVLREAGFM